jgi:hypothetical protein
MINIPIDVIIEKITEQTDLKEDDVQNKINSKLEQLSGLISKEGAAHIVANELGVKLMQTEGVMKIKNLMAGMRDVELDCKVIRKYDLRTFENARGQGKVFKFLVGDDTGVTMVVLWNDKSDFEKKFKENDLIKLKQVSIRDNNGRTEIHVGDGGEIEVNPKGVIIETQNNFAKPERKKISELKEKDENVEIFATVVQVFDPKFFKVNSDGKRIKEDENPEGATYGAVLNVFVDDGSDNIRTVLWKNQILNFLNVTEEELIKFKDAPEAFDEYKNKMLGTMMKFIGRTTLNEMFGKLEFVANVVLSDVNPEEEIKNLKENKEESKHKEKAEIKEEKTKKETKPEPKPEKKTEKSEPENDDDDLLSLEDIEEIDEEDI